MAAEAAAHSLCGCGQTVLFHGRQDTKIALDSAGVVVMNIAVYAKRKETIERVFADAKEKRGIQNPQRQTVRAL